MGLLQLVGALLRIAPQQLAEHRKELLSFGWNHLKRDGSSCKYYAFLAVARFLVAFHAPEKITLQVRLHSRLNARPHFPPSSMSLQTSLHEMWRPICTCRVSSLLQCATAIGALPLWLLQKCRSVVILHSVLSRRCLWHCYARCSRT